MTVRKFIAPSAREALRKVKEELGPDAVVVSNKAVAEGVEIVAMSPDSLDELSRPAPARPSRAPAGIGAAAAPRPPVAVAPRGRVEDDAGDDYTVMLSGKAKAQAPFRPWQPAQSVAPARAEAAATADSRRLRPLPERSNSPEVPSEAQVAATLRRAGATLPASSGNAGSRFGSEAEKLRSFLDSDPQPRELADSLDNDTARLMSEMKAIKSLLERQLGGLAWGDMAREAPTKALLLAEMLDAGFSGELSRRLIDDMPPDLTAETGRKWLQSAVNRRLRTLAAGADIIERGGVFALVGPTGVGKTTTTAKLAARCVVRYGAERLALLTTDSYRIGAHEQLRIYGRILGVPVHVVRDGEDLRRTLNDLRDKHMVLIDTVGMSQRDRMVAEQAAMLARAGEVSRLLLLSATSRGDTLDDVIRAYSGEDLAGVILTKIDEAASLAPALDAVVRRGLLLTHLANGQRVPEDLHLPNRSYILHRAFKQGGSESPHRLRDIEVGMRMPASAEAQPRASLV